MMRLKVFIVTAITAATLLSVAVVVPTAVAAIAFGQIPELSMLLSSISSLYINFPLDLTAMPIVTWDIKHSLPFPPVDITGEVPDPETPIPVPLPEIEVFLELGNTPQAE